MQAIELQAQITSTHEIHLKLPESVTASVAKVIVMYENIVPNQETLNAIDAVRNGEVQRYESLNAMWAYLDND